MSGGCARCCSYGSYEQRRTKAIWLARVISAEMNPIDRWEQAADALCKTGALMLVFCAGVAFTVLLFVGCYFIFGGK